ncbi:hypothetical protein [Olivibacter ginsenosidimutans]
MNQNKIQLYTYPSEKSRSDAFFKNYHVNKLVDIKKDRDRQTLKAKKERLCRFCGKSYPETIFTKKAHSISHFLGNNFLLNDFECDKCNLQFAKYETYLGEYLKVYRILNGTKGKHAIPKIKSSDGSQHVSRNDEGVINFTGKDLKVNGDEIYCQIKTSYKPIFMYKALVKMALSIMNDDDIPYYKEFIQNFLLHEENNEELSSMAKIGIYSVGRANRVDSLKYMLFQKKLDTNIPFHLFSLYYEDFIFVIPLPLHLYDFKKGYYEQMRVEMPPPLFFSIPNYEAKVEFEQLNLGTIDKVTKTDRMNFTLNSEQLREYIEKQLNADLPETFKIDGFGFKLNS